MKKFTIFVEVETNKPLEDVQKALSKGIYRGLDSPPYHIAPPNKVNIKFESMRKVYKGDKAKEVYNRPPKDI